MLAVRKNVASPSMCRTGVLNRKVRVLSSTMMPLRCNPSRSLACSFLPSPSRSVSNVHRFTLTLSITSCSGPSSGLMFVSPIFLRLATSFLPSTSMSGALRSSVNHFSHWSSVGGFIFRFCVEKIVSERACSRLVFSTSALGLRTSYINVQEW